MGDLHVKDSEQNRRPMSASGRPSMFAAILTLGHEGSIGILAS
jgi:hypothetical protein